MGDTEVDIYYQLLPALLRLLVEIDENDTLFSRHKLRPSKRIRVDRPRPLATMIPVLPQLY
ncbi:MAG: hypothetical protein ACSLEM_01835 [Candidatus Malihini olakiniferum]